jgi:hypothetical protein
MIANSLHLDIPPRGSTPRRRDGRPRRPLALLLSGLILVGVVAPPTADIAYAERTKYDKCMLVFANTYGWAPAASQENRQRYAKISCDRKLRGVTPTKEDLDFLDRMNTGSGL